MLKVNLKKISVEEFAKKYGLALKKEKYGDSVCAKIYAQDLGFVYLKINKENGRILEALDLGFDAYALGLVYFMFDMIQNGDVIKEEEQ